MPHVRYPYPRPNPNIFADIRILADEALRVNARASTDMRVWPYLGVAANADIIDNNHIAAIIEEGWQ